MRGFGEAVIDKPFCQFQTRRAFQDTNRVGVHDGEPVGSAVAEFVAPRFDDLRVGVKVDDGTIDDVADGDLLRHVARARRERLYVTADLSENLPALLPAVRLQDDLVDHVRAAAVARVGSPDAPDERGVSQILPRLDGRQFKAFLQHLVRHDPEARQRDTVPLMVGVVERHARNLLADVAQYRVRHDVRFEDAVLFQPQKRVGTAAEEQIDVDAFRRAFVFGLHESLNLRRAALIEPFDLDRLVVIRLHPLFEARLELILHRGGVGRDDAQRVRRRPGGGRGAGIGVVVVCRGVRSSVTFAARDNRRKA